MLNIVKILVTVLSGVGVGAVLDKVAADKLPAYPQDGVTPKDPATGGLHISKILWFVAAAVVGTLVAKFIGKKLNIKILK